MERVVRSFWISVISCPTVAEQLISGAVVRDEEGKVKDGEKKERKRGPEDLYVEDLK